MPLRSANFSDTLTDRQAIPRSLTIHKPRSLFMDTVQELPSNQQYERPRSNHSGGTPIVPDDLVLSASAPVANVVTFTWTGGTGPFTLDPGDGSGVIDPAVSGVTHDYTTAGAGDYAAVLSDSGAQSDGLTVTIP